MDYGATNRVLSYPSGNILLWRNGWVAYFLGFSCIGRVVSFQVSVDAVQGFK